MANVPVITEPDWDGKTPRSRTEAILLSIINGTAIDTNKWEGIPLSRGEYLLLKLKEVVEDNSMLDFKGRVDSVDDLPSTGNKKGDAYSVGPEEQLNRPEYFWTGSSWEYLGQLVDLSGYATLQDVASALQGYLPLSGGTMTGPLQFNIANKHLTMGVVSGNTQISSSDSKIYMSSSVGVDVAISGGQVTLGGPSSTYKAFTYNHSSNTTSIWGADMVVEGGVSITEKSVPTSGNQYTNVISQTSSGVTAVTKGALTGIADNGVMLQSVTNNNANGMLNIGTSGTSLMSMSKPLTIQANGQNLTMQTQYGSAEITANGGKLALKSNAGPESGLTLEGYGSPITAMSTNYVSITSPYAAGYVYLQGGTGSSEANINLSGGSISETAYANVSLSARNGTISLSSGNNSSWTAAGNLDLTATNGQARLQGATVSIVDQNSLITMGTPGTTVSVNNGGDLTLQTAGTSGTSVGDINVLSILGDVVVGAGNDLLLSAINGSIESNSSDYELEAYNSETDQQSDIHNYHGTVVTEFTPSTQNDPASNKITIKADHTISGNPGTTEGEAKIELTSDDGGLITMTTPSFDINGVPVYISTTQPTGNIPIGAIGLGW